MTHKVFNKDEQGYLTWISQHPNGYVLTTTRGISLDYLSLHRSTCRMISKRMSNMAPGAFTERKYIKICADTTDDLKKWINQQEQGDTDFTKLCKFCKPVINNDPDELSLKINDFEKKVIESLKDSSEARGKRLPKATKQPKKVVVKTVVFERNPDVVAEVLYKADGRCGKCKQKAPFNRRKDGSPYLEVHHRKPLADGGDDTVENAIALCPNCHRKAHYG